MLAAAVWHNVLNAVDVNRSGTASPIDALWVINELARSEYTDPRTGELAAEVPDGFENPHYDVNCDGLATPRDALYVINALGGLGFDPAFAFTTTTNITGQSGGVTAAGCDARLHEGDSLRTEITATVDVTREGQGLRLLFDAPSFDTASSGAMQDAFEVTVTDQEGRTVTQPFMPERQAAMNWSERTDAAMGASTSMAIPPESSDDPHELLINLSHLPIGEQVDITARLINNDGDATTSVVIRDLQLVSGLDDSSDVYVSAASGLSEPAFVDFDRLQDISSSIGATYGRTSYTPDRTQVITELVVTNRGSQAVTGDLIVVLDRFTELATDVMHPDGILPDGRPFFNLTGYAEGPLSPGESTRPREVRFTNPGDNPFSYRLLTLGDLNTAPADFVSSPITQIEADRILMHRFVARDPDGDSLTYSVVAGPAGMTIDPQSGELDWQTRIENVGRHRYTVRATDPHGLFTEQQYDIEVLAVLQNRPPTFVTDPVTEAIASSGFEITTVGVGDAPAGVGVISGFQGPRIVTANSGDQTIGVYAGENNDRFDDATSFSTGLPAANGQLFDVGYSVDIGLRPYRDRFDRNEVLGLDQADLNGDGIMDFVAMSLDQYTFAGTQYDFSINAMIGDGDGNFEATKIYTDSVGTNNYGFRNLTLRDINGDDAADLLAIQRAPTARLISMLNNGDGTFSDASFRTLSDSRQLVDFRVADIDGDNTLDLIGRTAPGASTSNYEAVWLPGIGDGMFDDPVVIAAAGSDGSPGNSPLLRPYDVGDVNGDGSPDLVLMTFGKTSLYHNDGQGNFTLVGESNPAFVREVHWLRIGDFNGDGKGDLLQHDGGDFYLHEGTGDGINFNYRVVGSANGQVGNGTGGFEPADIDADGDLDIIFGTTSSNQVSTFVGINDGTGNFVIREYAIPDFSGQTHPNQSSTIVRGGMFGDYNNDGVTDFSYYTQSGDFDGVGIRLGTRPGEFGRSRSIPWVENSRFVVAVPGDFDGDGDIDLVDTLNDRTFLNLGDGTFSDPFPASGQIGGSPAGDSADFNLDGLADFVGTYNTQNTGGYFVALSNGDGTFNVTERVSNGTFYNYVNMETADFNGDGYADFYAKNSINNYIDFYINDPLNPGFFTRTTRYTLPPGSQGVNVSHWDSAYDVGDFTGDGILDFATAERDVNGDNVIKVVVYQGDGTGEFSRFSEFAGFDEGKQNGVLGSSVEPGDFVGGDIDSDGDRDLLAVSFLGTRVFLNNGDGTFAFDRLLRPVGTNGSIRDAWLVDFNEDGHLDLFQAGGNSSGPLTVWLGDGTGHFELAESAAIVASVSESGDPFADIDGDGHLDFVYATGGNGNYTSDDAVIYAGRREDLVDLVSVDLNSDGNEEVLAVQEQMDRLQIFVGDNLGELTRRPDLQTGRAPQAVTVGDLNDDGHFELFTANRASRTLGVFVGDLENGYTQTEIAVGIGPIDVEAADLDGDSNTDVAVLDDAENALWILSGDGSGTLSVPVAIPLGDRPERFVIADIDGDGEVDAVITLPDTQRLMIVPSIGSSVVSAPVYVNLASTPTDVAAISLNDDGNLDLAVTLRDQNTVELFYGLGQNQFARPQSITVGQAPERMTVADADEDGRQDLVVVNAGDATASVIYNRFDPNQVYRYDSEAVDPDDDSLTYAIVDGPGGLIIDPQTGDLLWAASPDQIGVHEVTISADDGLSGVATQSFKIAVQPARENVTPLIATTPETRIGAGEAFFYDASAIDGDGHPLRYRLLEAPEGATLDPVTGELTWDTRKDSALGTFISWSSAGYVRTPVNESLQPASITVESWFNWSVLPAGNGAHYLFSRSNNSGYAYGLSNRFNNTLRFEAHTDGGYQFYDFPFLFDTNQWYHFAISIDDSTNEVSVYANGLSLFTRPLPGSIDYSNRNPGIHDNFSQFRGATDNYRIWNTVRDAQQIREGLTTQYQNEPSLVLDYRFGEENELTVRDYSGNENHGYRVTNANPPGAADGLIDTGPQQFSISVEDGRGGVDIQTFTLHVLPELRGSINGSLFDDLDGDGMQDDGSEDPAEPGLEGWRLFIDINDNRFADPDEHQTTTDASGEYRFEDLLPGEYAVRVAPVSGFETPSGFAGLVERNQINNSGSATSYDLAINALALSQIRGQLKTEDDTPIALWKVYADLDNDGQRDASEPMAASDGDGNYALVGLSAGDYKLLTDTPAGWIDAAEIDGLMVTIGDDEVSTGNDFVLTPTNTSVTAGLHFVTEPPATIEGRQTYTYASVAFAIEAVDVVYDLSFAPDGMVVDPTTGLIAWRPTISQIGEHTVILRATAGKSIALQDFTVHVTAPNFVPVITALPGENAFLNTPHRFEIAAQDEESEELTFGLVGEDHGASVDATTGRFLWTPTSIGTFDFTLRVTDPSNASVEEVFTMVVTDTVPALELVDLRLPRDNYPVGQQTVARLSAMDSLGRSVDWSIDNAPDGFAVQPDGTILWTPAAAQLGSHTLQFVATTAEGTELDVHFDVDVTGSLVNSAPIVDSEPIRFAVIGHGYRYDIVASDADRDPLSFVLLESPAGMSIDPLRGTLRWTPGEDQLGESDVVVRVADTYGAETTQSYKLTVRRFGGPPIIQSVPETEASVGTAYFYSIDARDAEADPLVYRLLSAPTGMTISESTGEITWTPTIGQLGLQSAVIEVSDGVGGAATQAFAFLVSDGVPNQPPSINNSSPRFAAVGQAYQHTVEATDPESTALTYSLSESPTGMTIDAASGEVNWTPATGQDGKHVVTIRVIDAGGAASIESFEIDVLAQNTPPVINGQPATEEAAGAEFKYDVLASDADLDRLIFELTDAPDGATVDTFGSIRWQTEVADIGDHDFSIVVRDPRGGVASQDFTLSVIEDLVPPKLSLIENLGDAGRNILPWMGPFRVFVKATDNVEVASLTLQANGQDIPLDAAGTATFTFEDWTFAAINATATAIDTNGNITTKTISFDYDIPEGWGGAGVDDIPTAIITSPADTASVTGMVSIQGTADHEDFATYRLSYRGLDETRFTEILQSDTAVVDGELGVWDTSLLINDEYVIRLEVATTGGVANVVEHNVGLGGELKLGNFRLSFTDMVIPVAGIPIEITRIYDTLQADRQGDFGYGWRLEYRDTDLRVGLPKSGLEDIGIYSPMRPGVKVYLNIPGQGRQGFTFDPDIRVLPGWGGNNLVLARPRFAPDPGVTARLSTGTNGYLQVNEQGELFAPGGIPYNPASPDFGGAYVVTTRDGITYRVSGASGELVSARDRNSNTIQFADDGVRSESGVNVIIERESSGRIVSIIDPAGERTQYSYSASGDLQTSTDREGNETRYVYDSDHRLGSVIDPLGREGVRTEYDENGRILKTFDLAGNAVNIATDTANRVQVVTDEAGFDRVLQYDQFGNVVGDTDALGNTTTYQFNTSNELVRQVDAHGNVTFLTWSNGRITGLMLPDGSEVRHEYDANGNRTRTLDQRGNATKFQYDERGNLIETLLPSGASRTVEYDQRGNAIRSTDELGNETTSEFDRHGNPVVQTMPAGATYFSDYDSAGRKVNSRVSRVLPDNSIVELSVRRDYDSNGQVTRVTDAFGESVVTTYNGAGQATEIVDQLGQRTSFQYGTGSFADRVATTGGEVVQYDYDDRRQVTGIVNQIGQADRYEYDAVGRVIRRTLVDDTPDNPNDDPTHEFQYDALGQIIATVDPGGARREFEYDALGRRILQRDALGTQVSFQYDASGNLSRIVDSKLGVTTHEYDSMNRLVKTTHPDGSVVTYSHDLRGNVVGTDDANFGTQQMDFDAAGRLTSVTNPLGHRTHYRYDSFGNLIEQEDANGNVTQMEYDHHGRQTAVIRPLGNRLERSFTPTGKLATVTRFDGTLIEYNYDSSDRLSEIRFDGETISYVYDDAGNTVLISDSEGDISFEYDQTSRLTRKTDASGDSIDYQYDEIGNLVAVATSFGATTYEYDAEHRVVGVIDPEGNRTEIDYDEFGAPRQVRYGNGLVEHRVFDARQRLVEKRLVDDAGDVVDQIRFSRDNLGNVLMVERLDGSTEVFAYDANYQLVAVTRTNAQGEQSLQQFTYDGVGNRISQLIDGNSLEYVYNANDELQEIRNGSDVTIFAYDANGQLVSRQNGNDAVSFDWTAFGRLENVTSTSNGMSESVGYRYDALGNRVSRTIDGTETRYVLDTTRDLPMVLEERSQQGDVTVRYTYSDELFGQLRSNDDSYYFTDHIGSVVGVTDSDGALVNQYQYSPFGRLLASTVGMENSYGFSGERIDPDNGLVHMRARDYSPELGRFFSQDPFEGTVTDPQTLHRYLYARNSPNIATDPSGAVTFTEVAVSSALIGGLAAATLRFVAPIYQRLFETVDWTGRNYSAGFDPTGGLDELASAGWVGSSVGLQLNLYQTTNGPTQHGELTYDTYWKTGSITIFAGLSLGPAIGAPAFATTGGFEIGVPRAFTIRRWPSLTTGGPYLLTDTSVAAGPFGYTLSSTLVMGLGVGNANGESFNLVGAVIPSLGIQSSITAGLSIPFPSIWYGNSFD